MSESCCEAANDPNVSTSLVLSDVLGAWKVRCGIGRDNYLVKPGLYAVGKTDSNSPVLVSANYKLSFDTLRKNLTGLDCWLLILDTKGINVWCAAGKGTFGTEELVNRIEKSGLAEYVTHGNLILPQLGASGISAHEVTKRTGFSVLYGPVRAEDIKSFISADFKASEEMRRVRFDFWDRLVLAPMELVEVAKFTLPVYGVLFIINIVAKRQFGIYDVVLYVGTVFTGAFFTPVLLPFIPGRAFSFKGWLMGLAWVSMAFWLFGWFALEFWLLVIGYGLLLPAFSAFLAMNFTGATTYTSPSGVVREMKIALPFILVTALAGAVLVLIKTIFG